jgi:twitching motility protein PilT
MFDVKHALTELVERGGSDLHLKVGSGPLFRIDGELTVDVDTPPLAAEDTEHALETLLDDRTSSPANMRSTSHSNCLKSPASG